MSVCTGAVVDYNTPQRVVYGRLDYHGRSHRAFGLPRKQHPPTHPCRGNQGTEIWAGVDDRPREPAGLRSQSGETRGATRAKAEGLTSYGIMNYD